MPSQGESFGVLERYEIRDKRFLSMRNGGSGQQVQSVFLCVNKAQGMERIMEDTLIASLHAYKGYRK